MWDIWLHIHSRGNVRDLAMKIQNKVLVGQYHPLVYRWYSAGPKIPDHFAVTDRAHGRSLTTNKTQRRPPALSNSTTTTPASQLRANVLMRSQKLRRFDSKILAQSKSAQSDIISQPSPAWWFSRTAQERPFGRQRRSSPRWWTLSARANMASLAPVWAEQRRPGVAGC